MDSWITSVSCSSTSVLAENAKGMSLILEWLRFIFLSPCPQRALLTSIDVIFLFILFAFAIQKLYSRFTSNKTTTSNVHEPLITKTSVGVSTNLWFKLSLFVTAVLTCLSVALSVLAFTQNTQMPWKLIDGICWMIQALSFLSITVLIIHEKRYKVVTHPLTLRVFWVVNFVVIALLASSSVVRLVSGTRNTSAFKSEDIISLIYVPFSIFLLVLSVNGSTGIIVTPEAESLNGNGNGKVIHAAELNKSAFVSGWASASILSKVFWLWMNPLLTKGYTAPLKLEDIPMLSPEHQALNWRSAMHINNRTSSSNFPLL